MAAWLTVLPIQAPPARTHDAVVRLSLWLSGHSQPHTRRQMLQDAMRAQAQETEPASAPR